MIPVLARFFRDESGGTAAEFAVVALVAIGLTLGVIDMGRFAWELNSAKAATRAGARLAVVSTMVSQTYANYDATAHGYYAGEAMPANPSGLGGNVDTCTSTACSLGGRNAAPFNAIVAEMQGYFSHVTPQNVVVEYRHVGLGIAGNPYAPDIEPIVTVRIQNLTFSPGVLQIFGMAPFLLPSMSTSLSGENLGVIPS
jgi:Flp pilus assembly protein TadG